ncbi:protein-disulfide reductase DsbD domain-containing protein [Jiella mangrovi]|uniref:Thiol:disulfide interchange protein DsbD N-terminal domain-containing protein n=1 Tax=Jiella mangrovi TaxID=2821407 RepID=A0ABS4BCL5_9HYPH|nr:protein-disulfide reductase DsbD domain-containing protein [Jiella mangrovi]MBP0614500.1 hypothetical protein [Jiella mangrovi]
MLSLCRHFRQDRLTGARRHAICAVRPWRRRLTGAVLKTAAAILLLAASPSMAAGSRTSVFQNDEVTLRLVRAAGPDAGTVRVALLVDLAPGWKTYWIDPGASGIPPQIDLSKTEGVASVHDHFPPPHRFGEDDTRANGYKGDVAFAFELDTRPGETIGAVKAAIFLGVCNDICIPVQAELQTAGADDEAAVTSAFAALPQAAPAGAFSVSAGPDGKTLRVTVKSGDEPKDDAAPDLFVISKDGWYFDEPTQVTRKGDTQVFDVPIAEAPAGAQTSPATIDLLYTAGSAAVEAENVPVEP